MSRIKEIKVDVKRINERLGNTLIAKTGGKIQSGGWLFNDYDETRETPVSERILALENYLKIEYVNTGVPDGYRYRKIIKTKKK